MSSLHVHYEYEDGSANTIRPTSVTYPDGRVLTYNYGTTGGMNDKLSRVESLGFDGTGNLVQPAYLGLGTQVRTTYSEPQMRWDLATGTSPNPYAGLDRFGRVIDNKWINYNTSATLDQIKYTYDRASNRTSRENVVAKAQTTPKYFDELYGYDGSNRLTLMERGQLAGSPPSSVTNKQFAQDWGLDPTGNWKAFKEDANGDGTWELNQTRTSNPVNEITAINETAGPSWVTPGYDSAGNMTTIPRPAEPTGDFTGIYDAWNRLVELRGLDDTVVARYEYDGLTRRVVKHTFPGWEELEAADWDAMTEEDWNGLQLTQAHRRDYYYNTSWQILEERVENGTAFDRQYVWGLRYIDGLVFRDRQLTSSVERTYALQDANWNVTALTDGNGAVVERYSYSAYGVPSFLNPDFTPTANQEACDWDVLYAGYKWDSESALYQVRFRYLQPGLGGWVSRDLIGYGGHLNLSIYGDGSPAVYIDSLGLAPCTCNCPANMDDSTDKINEIFVDAIKNSSTANTTAERKAAILKSLIGDLNKPGSRYETNIQKTINTLKNIKGKFYLNDCPNPFILNDKIEKEVKRFFNPNSYTAKITCKGKTFCIGVDKFGHLVEQGFAYYEIVNKFYPNDRKKGESYAKIWGQYTEGYPTKQWDAYNGDVWDFVNGRVPTKLPDKLFSDAAQSRIGGYGHFSDSTRFGPVGLGQGGKPASASPADLAANDSGYILYNDLAKADWKMPDNFHICNYINDGWDHLQHPNVDGANRGARLPQRPN